MTPRTPAGLGPGGFGKLFSLSAEIGIHHRRAETPETLPTPGLQKQTARRIVKRKGEESVWPYESGGGVDLRRFSPNPGSAACTGRSSRSGSGPGKAREPLSWAARQGSFKKSRLLAARVGVSFFSLVGGFN